MLNFLVDLTAAAVAIFIARLRLYVSVSKN